VDGLSSERTCECCTSNRDTSPELELCGSTGFDSLRAKLVQVGGDWAQRLAEEELDNITLQVNVHGGG
jgi:hypothetical protein